MIASGLCFAATGASAQAVEMGVPGLVVKNLACDRRTGTLSVVTGNIVNRSDQPVKGILFMDVLDQENDPVDRVVLA